MIKSFAEGEVRLFHLFYNNPEDVLNGKFKPQVIDSVDVKNMYPQFFEESKNLRDDQYMFIFDHLLNF